MKVDTLQSSPPFSLVIADIHLQPHSHPINRAFLDFLHSQAPKAEALYILGDLFEMWVGDDIGMEHYQEFVSVFKQLKAQGVEIYLLYGNRDFLMKRRFFAETGIEKLDDIELIERYGHNYIMLHGDSLCTDDKGYQKMRRWFRKPWVQWLFLKLSRHQRLKIGLSMRQSSQQHSQNKNQSIMDVNPEAVQSLFTDYAPTCFMLHGHTHRPAVHQHNLNHADKKRYVLGDWRLNGKKQVDAEIIKLDASGPQLVDFQQL
ncbi:UDP-2,3-diacylglucosamine diphosphatase [Thiomicrorhabdus sediminis]|uniref:UDP-2,3-diacylglucosamine hydrolase n=1 Tax=Thiomicrorhabdus sediminis TaxID=2580412 RepID=A0A4P9K5U2_9GAMM|nr:UDP-2,3-diacylglucosamine diphosphatase [Thiomicrorhabdus sediminis]QCU90375.1 UDP-2,3-diacylglucosamine diphosphatase [Thiomicrorhabdus sediminis]